MKCIYPGSFDPVTRGHTDVIFRLSRIFDEVLVGVLHNVAKQGCCTVEERVEMLAAACAGVPNVRIVAWSGLLADLARESGIRTVVKGIRSVSDADSEMAQARANALLMPDLETLLIPCSTGMEGISSSAAREVAAFGGDLTSFVIPEVAERLRRRFARDMAQGT